ncbi:MAG: hypothetical protein QMC81_02540 [Thermoanaerobacterales bacterium]|nr:hypothetical protein [Thermoanaerobacterales bacterium]
MAGKVKEDFGDEVAVEIVPPQDRDNDGNPQTPEPPNIAVDGKLLGKRVTLSQLEREVAARLEAR